LRFVNRCDSAGGEAIDPRRIRAIYVLDDDTRYGLAPV
jgi:hypothetical protein